MKKNETNVVSVRAKRSFREVLPSWILLIGLVLFCGILYLINPNVFSLISIK